MATGHLGNFDTMMEWWAEEGTASRPMEGDLPLADCRWGPMPFCSLSQLASSEGVLRARKTCNVSTEDRRTGAIMVEKESGAIWLAWAKAADEPGRVEVVCVHAAVLSCGGYLCFSLFVM